MKKYYWECMNEDGSRSEGYFSLYRRVIGRLFLGEEFIKIGLWHE